MRISDWSSDVCSSDLADEFGVQADAAGVLSDAEFQFRGVFDPVGHGVMVEWQWRSLPGASGQRQMPDGEAQARAHARTPGDGVIWRHDFSGAGFARSLPERRAGVADRKSTRLNSSH